MQQQKRSRSEQARINGAKSKGPKTEEGKEKCAKVNLKHAAYAAKATVLPHEDPKAYELLWATIVDQFHPGNAFEYGIVDEIVNHQWAARRLSRAAQQVTANQMQEFLRNCPTDQTPEEAYIRVETEGRAAAERLERRARAHTRDIARLVKLLNDIRKYSKSDGGSKQVIEMMDRAVAAASQSKPKPSRPKREGPFPEWLEPVSPENPQEIPSQKPPIS
ncbi:MAG: hypothetical protein FJW30_05235 [Acidobacteria bacterium]|nr:hypothetical protein [Acidobacteriota bacterium]